MFKSIFIKICFFVPFLQVIASHPWPFEPFGSPHSITGTLGEYREGHLHAGADIAESIGTKVYPVVNGVVEDVRNENTDMECVQIKGNDGIKYEYIHIKASVKEKDSVIAGETELGRIKELRRMRPHLHFEVNDGADNPLDTNGLTPYADDAVPKVYNGSNFSFYKQGSSKKLSSPLWGKVDILVRARDNQSLGSDTVSVYRIGYDIALDESLADVLTRQGFGYHENIKFDNAFGNVNYIYDKTQSTRSIYYYWVTNALGLEKEDYDCWWNTKLKDGEKWDGADAKINTVAMYPDDKYKITVVAYDIKGNRAEKNKKIFLDNFVPFAERVIVYKDLNIKYKGQWELSGNEMHLNIPADDSVSVGDKILLAISFSERMESQINVKLKKDREELSVEGIWVGTSKALWQGEVTIPDKEESVGEWTIMVSAKDLANHTLDTDPSTIVKRDDDGNWIKEKYEKKSVWDENHKIHVGEPPPPRVVYSDPHDNEQDVPVNKDAITIEFSKPMDQVETIDAVNIDPSFSYTSYWVDEKKLNLELVDVLDYCGEYTITVTDAATDTFRVELDGNTDSDGKPGGNHEFRFSTEKPELIVEGFPVAAHVGEGESRTHNVFTRGDKLKADVNCRIDFDISNPGGWSVSGANDASFSLLPDEEHENTYTVTNNGATASLDVLYQLGAKCATEGGEGFYWTSQGHQHDHPDENQSPGKMEYPTPWLTRTQFSPTETQKLRGESTSPEGLPDIGILLSGWADGYGHILGKYGIETLPVKPDLEIINNPDVDISDAVKLLVIGSAGLKGFNSPTFKRGLEDYVVNGGNLLVFTQKYGLDLSVLPGNIDGYGWEEDQSCFKLITKLHTYILDKSV